MTMVDAPAPRLSTLALAGYALPQLPLAALYFPVFVYLAPFYAAERGVDLGALGLVLIATRLLDAATDPAMGWLTDRWRPRFGRRKIWLALSTPLVALAVWQAMVPPPDAGLGHAALWLVALTLGWTMALTPYFAWGAEIAQDYAGRARATAWRESLFLVGTLAAAAFYVQGGGGGGGLRAIAIAVVVALPITVALALWLAPEPQDRTRADAPPITLREGYAAIAANRPFRLLLGSYFLNSAANALPAALFVFYVGHVLQADAEAVGLLLGLYFLSAVVAAPVWAWAARRVAKHVAWAWAMIYACAVFAGALLLGPGDVGWFAVVCVMTGLAFGADIVLPPAMQADVVDVDTAATGRQRTGLFFAFWSVATKAASALAAGLGLLALDLVGFDAEGGNDAAALTTLAVAYAGAPIVLKLWAVWLVRDYPIDAAAQEALRRRIADATVVHKRPA